MSSKQRSTIARRSNSRITEIWRSALSWMRWRLMARKRRRQQELDEQRERLLFALLTVLPTHRQVEEIVHQQLMLAMQPLAQALTRQDSLLLEQMTGRETHLRQATNSLEDLLKEVLNSLQPTVEEQLYLRDGRWTRPPLPPNLAS